MYGGRIHTAKRTSPRLSRRSHEAAPLIPVYRPEGWPWGLPWRKAPDGTARRVGEAINPGPEKGLLLRLASINVTSLAPVVDLIDALPCDVVALQECRVGGEYRFLPSRAPSEVKPVP